MNHDHQVQNICKEAFFHITQKDTETLVHASVTSKLNNCNTPVAKLPQYLIHKVQRVHNAAVRKYDKITPVLKELS